MVFQAASGGWSREWVKTTVRGMHRPAGLRRVLDYKGYGDAASHACILCAAIVSSVRAGQGFCLQRRARRQSKSIAPRMYDSQGLDEEQERVIKLVREGKNVVLTGGAGVGKTFTSEKICAYFREKYGEAFRQKVAVTASTGVAAALLGGSTVHSVTRVGVPNVVSHFMRTCKQKIWDKIETLIIDEASMISGEFFDRLSQAICSKKNSTVPFAGIQVVLIGDFLQLPPIVRAVPPEAKLLKDGTAVLPGGHDAADPSFQLFLNRGYVYQSKCFREMDFVVVELKTPHRQGDRREFVEFLNHIREGSCPKQELDDFNQRLQKPLPKNMLYTTLVPYTNLAERVNCRHLGWLKGETRKFKSSDDVDVLTEDSPGEREFMKREKTLYDSFKTHVRAEMMVSLKVGAQVMLLVNLWPEEGLVNGSLGVVKGFFKVHKKEALKFVPRHAHATVLEWLTRTCCSNQQDPEEDRLYVIPRVQFQGRSDELFIGPWKSTWDIAGVGSCTRTQFPLALGWAITHHKAQGITVHSDRGEGIRVDPKGFTEGQVYVALSRVTDERGLQLLSSIIPKDIIVSSNALLFYEAVRKFNENSLTTPKFRDMGPRAALTAALEAGDQSADHFEKCVAAFDCLGTWEQIKPHASKKT